MIGMARQQARWNECAVMLLLQKSAAMRTDKISMSADQSADSMPHADSIRLFLCGDVMTGRGIDQVLPHPNDPTLHEPCTFYNFFMIRY